MRENIFRNPERNGKKFERGGVETRRGKRNHPKEGTKKLQQHEGSGNLNGRRRVFLKMLSGYQKSAGALSRQSKQMILFLQLPTTVLF